MDGQPGLLGKGGDTRVTFLVRSWLLLQSDNIIANNIKADNETRLKAAEASISTNASNITSLQTNLTSAQEDITTNATNISSLQTNLTSAQKNITTNASNITSLQSKISSLESTVTILTNQIKVLASVIKRQIVFSSSQSYIPQIASDMNTTFGWSGYNAMDVHNGNEIWMGDLLVYY